jgi:hypothetical protein
MRDPQRGRDLHTTLTLESRVRYDFGKCAKILQLRYKSAWA